MGVLNLTEFFESFEGGGTEPEEEETKELSVLELVEERSGMDDGWLSVKVEGAVCAGKDQEEGIGVESDREGGEGDWEGGEVGKEEGGGKEEGSGGREVEGDEEGGKED